MRRSAWRSWRRRGAAGSSANTPNATATPTPRGCSTRWRVSRKASRPSGNRQAAPDNGLKEALAAIRGAVDQARVAALDGLALEEKLAPVRKGSRIIREIAWRWREIGADGRICDLIDSQIGAIEEACGQIASINPLSAFDVIERQLAEFGGSEAAPGSPQAAAEDAPPAPSDEMLAALAEPLETTAAAPAEAAVRPSPVPAEQPVVTAKAEAMTAKTVGAPVDTPAATADVVAEATHATTGTVDAIAETADATAEPESLADRRSRRRGDPRPDRARNGGGRSVRLRRCRQYGVG